MTHFLSTLDEKCTGVALSNSSSVLGCDRAGVEGNFHEQAISFIIHCATASHTLSHPCLVPLHFLPSLYSLLLTLTRNALTWLPVSKFVVVQTICGCHGNDVTKFHLHASKFEE